MSTLLDLMATYGADINGALERFVGDEELYEQCLREFKDDECWNELDQALENRDASAAFMAAHTLKGVAANLGLVPLFQALASVVEPLRAGSLEGSYTAYANLLQERERCPL